MIESGACVRLSRYNHPIPAELITLAVLAELSAGAVLSALAGPTLTKGYEKVQALLGKGALAGPLNRAFKQATLAFLEALQEEREFSEQELANLRVMVIDGAWAQAVAQLPYVSFKKIDTARCIELFEGLGPERTDTDDFDYAWRRLRKGFRDAVAELSTEPLRTLVEHAASERLIEVVEGIEESLRKAELPADEEPAIYEYRETLYERLW